MVNCCRYITVCNVDSSTSAASCTVCTTSFTRSPFLKTTYTCGCNVLLNSDCHADLQQVVLSDESSFNLYYHLGLIQLNAMSVNTTFQRFVWAKFHLKTLHETNSMSLATEGSGFPTFDFFGKIFV